ncbi:MAG TPA: hypothetical protein DDY77_00810 [Clostridiales bacterium]|nr:hypothetical protein [Clostridiales bacterium]
MKIKDDIYIFLKSTTFNFNLSIFNLSPSHAVAKCAAFAALGQLSIFHFQLKKHLSLTEIFR